MKALKVFENIHFERGSAPMDSMSIGRVKARAIQKRSFEAVDLMKELQKKYGGDIFFMELDEHGFKIILAKEKQRIFVEYNYERPVPPKMNPAWGDKKESFIIGYEEFTNEGRWRDIRWTSQIPGGSKKIETWEEVKSGLEDYIKDNNLLGYGN